MEGGAKETIGVGPAIGGHFCHIGGERSGGKGVERKEGGKGVERKEGGKGMERKEGGKGVERKEGGKGNH